MVSTLLFIDLPVSCANLYSLSLVYISDHRYYIYDIKIRIDVAYH